MVKHHDANIEDITMRTTLTIEDQLLAALKDAAHQSGKPFKQVVNEVMRKGLLANDRPAVRPYRMKPASMGSVGAGLNLDKALELADALEHAAVMMELEARK